MLLHVDEQSPLQYPHTQVRSVCQLEIAPPGQSAELGGQTKFTTHSPKASLQLTHGPVPPLPPPPMALPPLALPPMPSPPLPPTPLVLLALVVLAEVFVVAALVELVDVLVSSPAAQAYPQEPKQTAAITKRKARMAFLSSPLDSAAPRHQCGRM
jgi:hypothetical protein